jgi:hypothetical protein
MSTIDDKMKSKISLHGLGFIQVQLDGNQRMHVWHPDLPRRACFKDSAIHDHRFGFTSQVLVGILNSTMYKAEPKESERYATHAAYRHEGPRMAGGGRPWDRSGWVSIAEYKAHRANKWINPGDRYEIKPYELHTSMPVCQDGKAATIMTKTAEFSRGATSYCAVGVTPDAHFDRFQLPEEALWEYVLDVIGGRMFSVR